MSDGKHIVKVPIRSLDEYRFRYNFQKGRHVGSGDGDAKVGDVVASGQPEKQAGKGDGAGDKPGVDYAEADVSLEDIQSILFRELDLPNLVDKSNEQTMTETVDFRDVRKKGLSSNVDKKRTLIESIRRNRLHGDNQVRILPEDLRYKTWEDIKKPDSNATILAMMDLSGSMGLFEKYCARTFFFWMVRFLRTKYENVHIRYIAHHTEAHEVPEDYFFNKGESGGTICSSVYDFALQMIDREYPPLRYNIYPIHFSDGDNLTSDNERCVQLVKALCEKSQMFGYAEVNQYARNSTLMSAYGKFELPPFRKFVIRDKTEVYAALKHFFSTRDGGKPQ